MENEGPTKTMSKLNSIEGNEGYAERGRYRIQFEGEGR